MVLEEITYSIKGRKEKINVKRVSVFSTGLMFKKNSPPLLFSLRKEQTFSIHSVFCKPFRAIWLDKNMKTLKFIDVEGWKFKLKGRGKYLLEIPKDYSKKVNPRQRPNPPRNRKV